MQAYFEYLHDRLVRFWWDFVRFFSKRVVSPWTDVSDNFKYYGELLNSTKGEFGAAGWTFFVIFAILFAAAIFGVGYLIFFLCRKYIRFVKKELDKDELRRQVERLNYELYLSVQEKDKILNRKTTYLGLSPEEEKKKEEETVQEVASRFPKLTRVDQQYKGMDTNIPNVPELSLEELCNAFRNFAASKLHLYYKIDVIRQLFAGRATSKLIILEGISGTGKTSLAYALGKFFSFDSSIIPVQPSWKDRSELIGYYNEFTKKFNEMEFLRALYTTTYRKDLDVIVLDERNLARIEYYFAEFLSIMEMRDPNDWQIDLIPDVVPNDPLQFKNGKLLIPQNVEFFGTANNDDSTFTISDKVYDRAISIFFDDKGRAFEAEDQDARHIPYSQIVSLYQDALSQYPITENRVSKFNELDDFVIKKFHLAFGNRIRKQLETFIPVYIGCGGTERGGYDFRFTNKVLKKFESLNIAFLKDQLNQLLVKLDELYGEGNFPRAHNYIKNLLANS